MNRNFILGCGQGSAIEDARKLVMLALHHLPNHCRFNIVGFGSG